MSTPEPQAISVSDLTQQIRNVLEGSFPILWVSGEISNFVHHGSGHMYFTLKDEKAEIRGVMFKGFNQFLHFKPENGMQVLLQGDLTVYEARGQYQIVAKKMEPAGIGTLYLAFEALKKQLAAEGLFAPEVKQKLPVNPSCIGVITSQTGAAVRDVFQVLDRRAPHVDLILRPSRVQGDKAAIDLVEAINDMVTFDAVDGQGNALATSQRIYDYDQTIAARLDDISSVQDHVANQRAKVGARSNSLERQRDLLTERKSAVEKDMSEIADADLAELVTYLQSQITGLEASQQAFVKISRLSLFDYIR
mgnify:CR=1 FL=1